jgi:hypothetical protein
MRKMYRVIKQREFDRVSQYCEKNGWSKPIVCMGQFWAYPPGSNVQVPVPVAPPFVSRVGYGIRQVFSILLQIIGGILVIISTIMFLSSRN